MKVRVKQTGEVLEVKAIETVDGKVNEIGHHILHYNFFKPEEVEIVDEHENLYDKFNDATRSIENIVYTGPIADYYSGEICHLFLNHNYQFAKNRVAGKDKSCTRPVIVANIPAKSIWIEYVDDEISQYDSQNTLFTCEIEEIEELLNKNDYAQTGILPD